eukprot:GHUV01042367.1.p2 GENE.GHUV01042367.1~~GHUV01042367.1.p2  ORF type:complete len:130 (+),score=7.20 GHUV01042367.1:1495-1884(+)
MPLLLQVARTPPPQPAAPNSRTHILGFHSPLYSGLGMVGGSHSPSSSSDQSSGFLASGSTMVAGMSSQPAGFLSLASSIFSRSSQSAGFAALGSCNRAHQASTVGPMQASAMAVDAAVAQPPTVSTRVR